LRLLLDEMYPHRIAEQLRRKGHDVDAVSARAELRGCSDEQLFARAQHERRAVVTENVADFSRIADEQDRGGRPHHGLVLVDPSRFPRGSSRTIGRMVRGLDRLLEERRGDRAHSRREWL
jgi:predicted nuclease of predicted toxin-antitoxin system